AAYLGPQAPDRLATEAEAMAASVHLLPFDFSTLPPPPGSRPGFDAGGVDLPPGQGRVVATSDGSAGTYTVEADGDCAIVVPGSFPESALGGGCLTVPADGAAAGVAARAVDRGPPAGPPPPPVPGGGFVQPTAVAGEDLAVVVLARVGADTDGLTAVLVDGRTVDATVGDDGWALVVTDGRPYLLEARDGKGRVTGVTPVT
ncbi:MAG: hypothetical protein QOE93_1047, partial [Actinomycetota bacterium]|nr:hypothetical protein [Actinomycetota bacterium]